MTKNEKENEKTADEIFITRYNLMQNINCMIIKHQKEKLKLGIRLWCDFWWLLMKNRDNFI